MADPANDGDVAAFDEGTLRRMAEDEEVDIETWAAGRGPHRTIIWIVVADGIPLVRSVRGERGRWYQELKLETHGAVHLGDRRVPVRALPVEDDALIEACSRALAEKYSADPALRLMLLPEVLGTTLLLVPA